MKIFMKFVSIIVNAFDSSRDMLVHDRAVSILKSDKLLYKAMRIVEADRKEDKPKTVTPRIIVKKLGELYRIVVNINAAIKTKIKIRKEKGEDDHDNK